MGTRLQQIGFDVDPGFEKRVIQDITSGKASVPRLVLLCLTLQPRNEPVETAAGQEKES